MCDFTNDCGDRSDEKAAICKNFKERCNFETDTCNWYQDQSDNFDWTRSNGGTSSLDTGSGTDHTLGMLYVIFISAIKDHKLLGVCS